MSRTSKRYTSQCITPPPVDVPVDPHSCGPTNVQCNDPVYAAAHPDECNGGGTGGVLTLILKPSIASIRIGNTLQYATVVSVNGIENSVTAAVTYTSSNPSVASINTSTGQATGVANGVVTITATWHGLMAFAQLTVVTVCVNDATDHCIVLDTSASMGLPFNSSYATKLDFAIAGARAYASGIDFSRDTVSLAFFNVHGLGTVIRATALVDVNTGLDAIQQTPSLTSISAGIAIATDVLTGSTADRKVAMIFSDGEDRPSPDEVVNSVPDALSQLLSLGTIVEVCGVRAYGTGYALLTSLASGGFFLNAYNGTAGATITTLSTFAAYGTCSDYSLSTPPTAQTPDPVPSVDVEGDGGGGGGDGFSYTATFTAYCNGSDVGEPVTRSATYVSQISMADAQVHAEALAKQAAYADLSCCSNAVLINDFDAATPYPACYRVAGYVPAVTSVQVVLQNFTHPSPADISIVLVSPAGSAVVLVASCGVTSFPTHYPVTGLTLTFAAGGVAVPTASAWTNTTYAPTKCITAGVTVPDLGEVTNTDLSVFNGEDPNGVWHLYVRDGEGLDAGSIDSWFVVLNGTAGCSKTMAPGNIRITNFITVGPTLIPCSACSAATGGAPVWDGTFTPLAGRYKGPDGDYAFNGKSFLWAFINFFEASGGVCFWEMTVACIDHNAPPNPLPAHTIWTGRKSAAFGSDPIGIYDRVATTTGGGPPCSSGPSSVQIEAVP